MCVCVYVCACVYIYILIFKFQDSKLEDKRFCTNDSKHSLTSICSCFLLNRILIRTPFVIPTKCPLLINRNIKWASPAYVCTSVPSSVRSIPILKNQVLLGSSYLYVPWPVAASSLALSIKGTKYFRVTEGPQAKMISNLKNAKQKLLRKNAAIWFDKIKSTNTYIRKY